MLFADRIGARLAIGWTMGTVVSILGMYFSVLFDLPTGATIVCTFGLVLVLMALVRELFVGANPKALGALARGWGGSARCSCGTATPRRAERSDLLERWPQVHAGR